MAIKLIYSDLPLGASDDAEVTAGNYENFSEPSMLPFGVSSGAVATLEPNSWGLSSDIRTKDNQPFAFWSNFQSDENGLFSTPPTITIEFDAQYTATGLSFRFAPDSNEYCNKIFIEWWQNGTVKESGEFFPASAVYVLEKTVEAFDKIVVTFFSTNLPFRRAKIEALITGVVRVIDGRELISSRYINEIDLLSNTVPINILDASFHSSSKADLIFQKRQPVEAFDGEKLVGVYYIEAGERLGGYNYNISCQDAIGILNNDSYDGGIWFEDVLAVDIMTEIIAGAFELDIEPALMSATIRGHIKPGTKREALQQIAFALGACIDTSGTNKIKVFLPPTNNGAEISPKDTYTGGKVNISDTVTDVYLEAYEIRDEAPSQDWQEKLEFDDQEYVYETIRYYATNPNVSSGTLRNTVVYKECFLINSTNAQKRVNDIMAYYMRRNVYNASHVVKGQNAGDRVVVPLPWGDIQSGNIIKMQVTTSGITASNTDFLLD